MSNIPTDVEKRMNALLGSGRYASAAEVLRAAFAALEARDADLMAIEQGIDDMKNGRCRPFSEFDSEFRKRNRIEADT